MEGAVYYLREMARAFRAGITSYWPYVVIVGGLAVIVVIIVFVVYSTIY
jgi:hypothetical protein